MKNYLINHYETLFSAQPRDWDSIKLKNFLPMYESQITEEVLISAVDRYVNQHGSSCLQEFNDLITNGKPIPGSESLVVCTATNKDNHILHIIGMIREFAFRNAGVGVGKIDYDKYDYLDITKQLVVVNTEKKDDIARCIVGGYRYQYHDQKTSFLSGPTSQYFDFDDGMFDNPWIELGRSFLNPLAADRHSFGAVLQALGYVAHIHTDMVGLFGKVTLPYTLEFFGVRDSFLGVCRAYMNEALFSVKPTYEVKEGVPYNITNLTRILRETSSHIKEVNKNLNVSAIMHIYQKLCDFNKMQYGGAAKVLNFGQATEFGFAIRYENIYEKAKDQYVNIWK
jgi:hypothetical protein